MDLEKITDIKELKAIAYDQLSQLNACQRNIQLIEQRIAALQPPFSEPAAQSEADKQEAVEPGEE